MASLAGAVNLLDTSRSSMNKPSGQPRVCHLRSLFPAALSFSFSLAQSHIQSVSRCDLATFQSPAVNVCVIIPAICCSANCSCIPTIRYCLCVFPLALSRLHLLFTPRCISLTLSHTHTLCSVFPFSQHFGVFCFQWRRSFVAVPAPSWYSKDFCIRVFISRHTYICICVYPIYP